MNRVVLGIGLIALLAGGIAGFLGSGWRADRLEAQLQDAQTSAARFEREVGELRAQNDQIGARLKAEQARAQSTETDLQREKDMNARLHLLVSNGRK